MDKDITLYKWAEWPDHLLTKKQMSDAGFQIGKKLLPPVGKVARSKSPDGWMYLYDSCQGVPKLNMSDAQKTALKKAQDNAKVVYVTCSQCDGHVMDHKNNILKTTRKRFLSRQWTCDKCHIVTMATELLASDFVIIDTETTGLAHPEIIQISIIDSDGNVLVNTLVNPVREIEQGAIDIHGITAETVKDAPTYGDIYGDIISAIGRRTVAIYNAAFDLNAMVISKREYHLPSMSISKVVCVMEMYSQFVGDWNSYYGNYRWQKLPGGDHTALGDCLATLALIHDMANKDFHEI